MTTPPTRALLWVLDGEALWRAKTGAGERACAHCHGDARLSMKGAAARYPAYDERRATAIDLEGRINVCRAEHQKAPPLAREGKELLALTASRRHASWQSPSAGRASGVAEAARAREATPEPRCRAVTGAKEIRRSVEVGYVRRSGAASLAAVPVGESPTSRGVQPLL